MHTTTALIYSSGRMYPAVTLASVTLGGNGGGMKEWNQILGSGSLAAMTQAAVTLGERGGEGGKDDMSSKAKPHTVILLP